MLEMSELDLRNQRVVIREDLNVPLKKGKITSDARLVAVLPTIRQALDMGAAVILLSHLGRPVEGQFDPALSLQPVAERLTQLLGQSVRFVQDYHNGVEASPGDVILCENVRFEEGEKANDAALAARFAALGDVFVMDAFATSHRAHASTVGAGMRAARACAGPLLAAEVHALQTALKSPQSPVVAIVGGSKVSTKLTVLRSLVETVDCLIVGGGIANTFLAAAGHSVGCSLYEEELLDEAKAIMAALDRKGAVLPIPTDVRVATEFTDTAQAVIKPIDAVLGHEMILDIGPASSQAIAALIKDAKTIVWNGPLGVFEFEHFGEGTRCLGEAIASSDAFSLAGGGDTIAAIEKYGLTKEISYISTAGGAFLEFLEGKSLPAIEMLKQRAF